MAPRELLWLSAAAGVPRPPRSWGRLVDAASGEGVPGRVRVEGPVGGALEARAQWLGGTDHDAWITVNEWEQATGLDGAFALDGLPPGQRSLRVQGVGASPRRVEVSVTAGAVTELGPLAATSSR